MRRAVFVVVAVLLCCPMGSFGQGVPSTPITLTDKITHLEGVWVLDPTKGVRGSCATTDQPDQTIRISVSPQGVNVESGRLTKLLPLDGSPVTVRDKTVATAALDAGWLAITIRVVAPNNRGATNVHRDVYIAERRQMPLESNVNYDELTIWRSFTMEWPDGSLSSPVCSYRAALVYRRQK
jgi:hypothetical protein